MYFLPLLAQIEAEKTIQKQGFLDLVFGAHPVVQATLVLLILFSIISWAIIFYKWKQVRQAQSHSQSFWASMTKAKSIHDVVVDRDNRAGPLYEIVRAAIEFLPRLQKSGKSVRLARDQIVQKLSQAREEEIYKLEQYTSFLATTASTAPFIGLFGTVWGILTAFWAIGQEGSSSLATVGPYISEALVATALGLAAAIPAVVAYNFFAGRIKTLVKMMDLFMDDVLLKLEEESV